MRRNEDSAPRPSSTPVELEDTFYCRARRRRLTLERCLDDYLDANAFNQRKTACWRCPQGRLNRENFAKG